MKKDIRIGQFLGCVAMALLLNSAARADSFQTITSLSGNTQTINWGTMAGETITSNPPTATGTTAFTSGNSTLVTIGDPGGPGTYWYEESFTWQSGGGSPNFPANQVLIGPYNPMISQQNGDLTLTFGSDIAAFGALIQDFNYSSTFDVFVSIDGGSTLGVNEFEFNSSGNPVFIGLQDLNGAGISSLAISIPNSSGGGTAGSPGYFAMGTATVIQNGTIFTTTPEPGSLLLMAGGLAALAWTVRKRVRA